MVRYEVKKSSYLSRSDGITNKRTSSLFDSSNIQQLNDNLNINVKRKVSTSSDSSSEDVFERDDESGKTTACTNRHIGSRYSASESTNNGIEK